MSDAQNTSSSLSSPSSPMNAPWPHWSAVISALATTGSFLINATNAWKAGTVMTFAWDWVPLATTFVAAIGSFVAVGVSASARRVLAQTKTSLDSANDDVSAARDGESREKARADKVDNDHALLNRRLVDTYKNGQGFKIGIIEPGPGHSDYSFLSKKTQVLHCTLVVFNGSPFSWTIEDFRLSALHCVSLGQQPLSHDIVSVIANNRPISIPPCTMLRVSFSATSKQPCDYPSSPQTFHFEGLAIMARRDGGEPVFVPAVDLRHGGNVHANVAILP